jgi:hypothetical protein
VAWRVLLAFLAILVLATPFVLRDNQYLPKPPDWQVLRALIAGFLASVGVADAIVPWLRERWYRRIDHDFRCKGFPLDGYKPDWQARRIGIIETFGYFVAFSFAGVQAAAFVIGGWLVLKMGTGWNFFSRPTERTDQDRYYRARAFGALKLYLLNVLFGALGAVVYHWYKST